MTDDHFEALAQKLEAAKAVEAQATAARVLIEAEIYTAAAEQCGGKLPDKGTSTFGRIKVETGFNETWDQAKLAEIKTSVPADQFPFKTVFQCVKKDLTNIATQHPQVYRQIFAALTSKPKKPSFSVVPVEQPEGA